MRKAIVLGFSLAVVAVVPAVAQTVVGGDGRPAVTVDRSVLDQLGPQPTLPDMLLGRQPLPQPTRPVKLHPPRAEAKVIKPASKKLAEGSAEAKSKAEVRHAEAKHKAKAPRVAEEKPKPERAPVKTAEAAPKPAHKTAKTETAAAATGNRASNGASNVSGKKLGTVYDAPPPPPEPKPTAVANADMPGGVMTPPPTRLDPAAGTAPPTKPAKPAKSLTSSQQTSASASANVDSAATPPAAAAPPSPAPTPAASANAAPPAPAVPPVESSATTEAKTEAKTAMLTPPPAAAPTVAGGEGVVMSIPFAKDSQALPDDMLSQLINLAKSVRADASLQLQVLAYAAGDADNVSKAQRLSLARALAVRAFLKDQGVPGARIDVRALGNRVPEGPSDRVDLVEQKH